MGGSPQLVTAPHQADDLHAARVGKEKNADSLEASMANWLVCVLHTGFHSVEWTQAQDIDKHRFYQANDPKK